MTAGKGWLAAFPLQHAHEAVDALCESWSLLAASYRTGFHPKCREPELTRVLKAHVERVTSRQRGLLGMWATESVINTVDFETAKILDERRTDIFYGWNNNEISIQLVFEFKKLDRRARSRSNYLGADGLLRFVTGIYSREQAVAAMVGILMDPKDDVVPALRESFADKAIAEAVRLTARPNGAHLDHPSLLFPGRADFDTEHDRPSGLAPDHGTIRVAHIFLAFGYGFAP